MMRRSGSRPIRYGSGRLTGIRSLRCATVAGKWMRCRVAVPLRWSMTYRSRRARWRGYHEGMRGHHMQMGRLAENTALHPIRRQMTELRTFALNGYLEGWAEYAAALCEEVGLYADPVDQYGRLSSERFHAARLVVDTGLNVLGWPRERAAAYLRANGFLADL